METESYTDRAPVVPVDGNAPGLRRGSAGRATPTGAPLPTGFTRDARNAGSRQAKPPTTPNSTGTSTNVPLSVGAVW
jgi:hypothetical protein